jgi:hypothetical protein
MTLEKKGRFCYYRYNNPWAKMESAMDEQVEGKLKKNWDAIVSFSLGVAGILVIIALINFPELDSLGYVPLGSSLLGTIFGVFGRSTDNYKEGQSLATVGLVLSIIPLCIYGFIFFLYSMNPAG